MATSKRHTFEEVLNNGITLQNTSDTIKIDKIFIPRIQRSYAQGRKSEYEIRTNFLDDIFKCLCNEKDEVLELSFLFGSKQPLTSGGEGFELLDGQQRVTTLFLMHWYLWMKEQSSSGAIPICFGRFTYETRDTSTQFINKIVEAPIPLKDKKPSKVIKSLKWFTEVFNCDATVSSMLIMLDNIDEKYKDRSCHDLYVKLKRLQFYVLYLDEFELNDELYIKMNSRGLDLTPFENFKASLIRYMKKQGGDFIKDVDYESALGVKTKMPYYLRFSTKMDTSWNDIFWTLPEVPCDTADNVNDVIDINNQEKDAKFFRFFIRYLFTKLVLKYDDKESDYKKLEDFFYKDTHKEGEFTAAESDYALRKKLVSWNQFLKIIEMLGYEGICNLEKVLDTFAVRYPTIHTLINSNPYAKAKAKKWDVFGVYKEYTLTNRVIFAALIEFIENIPSGMDFNDPIIQKNLNQMFRVMWNVIENTKIEDVKPTISVIKAMSELINLPNAVDKDFYTAISNNTVSSRNVQLFEEIAKARKISDNYKTDKDWEDIFDQAEKHPLFKGMVRFFYEDTIQTSSDFENRFKIMESLFDDSGITQSYRKDHLLIRAIISQMNYWEGDNGLGNKYITENSEEEGYLKILLGTAGASKLFCDYFNFYSTNSIQSYLTIVVQNAKWKTPNQSKFSRVFKRLVNDDTTVELLNQMFSIEEKRDRDKKKNKCFHIVEKSEVVLACIPHNDRIVLDTERHLIIKQLTTHDGFEFTYQEQKENMESPLGDTWWTKVYLQKNIITQSNNTINLMVEFDELRHVEFYIKINGSNSMQIPNNFEVKAGRYHYMANPVITYDNHFDYHNIKTTIDKIEQDLKSL